MSVWWPHVLYKDEAENLHNHGIWKIIANKKSQDGTEWYPALNILIRSSNLPGGRQGIRILRYQACFFTKGEILYKLK